MKNATKKEQISVEQAEEIVLKKFESAERVTGKAADIAINIGFLMLPLIPIILFVAMFFGILRNDFPWLLGL